MPDMELDAEEFYDILYEGKDLEWEPGPIYMGSAAHRQLQKNLEEYFPERESYITLTDSDLDSERRLDKIIIEECEEVVEFLLRYY